jgi:hypothetical protein
MIAQKCVTPGTPCEISRIQTTTGWKARPALGAELGGAIRCLQGVFELPEGVERARDGRVKK